MILRHVRKLLCSILPLLALTTVQAQGIDTLVSNGAYFADSTLLTSRDSAFNEFKKLIDSGNVKHFGITDPLEVDAGTIGEPWLETTITGHALRGYTPATHIPTLYSWETGRKFPVMNGGRAVGFFTLVNTGMGLKVRAYSPPRLANAVERAKQLAVARYAFIGSRLYAVRFPTLHRYFLAGRDASGELMFISVFGDSDLYMPQPGDISNARNVLSMLSDRARMDPGGPR
jgi:hypothetical protein